MIRSIDVGVRHECPGCNAHPDGDRDGSSLRTREVDPRDTRHRRRDVTACELGRCARARCGSARSAAGVSAPMRAEAGAREPCSPSAGHRRARVRHGRSHLASASRTRAARRTPWTRNGRRMRSRRACTGDDSATRPGDARGDDRHAVRPNVLRHPQTSSHVHPHPCHCGTRAHPWLRTSSSASWAPSWQPPWDSPACRSGPRGGS